jgi:hypothetical protein
MALYLRPQTGGAKLYDQPLAGFQLRAVIPSSKADAPFESASRKRFHLDYKASVGAPGAAPIYFPGVVQ